VAVRKTKNAPASNKGSPKKKSSSVKKGKKYSPVVLFWLAFVILIIGLFLFNREAINNSIKTMQNELAARKAPPGSRPLPDLTDQDERNLSDSTPVEQTRRQEPSQQPSPPAAQQAAPQTTTERSPAPAERQSAERQQPAAQQTAPRTTTPSGQGQQAGQSPAAGRSTEPVRSAEVRERALYFTQVDRGGSILRVKTNRRLPVSDTPLLDVLQALIAGPNAEERQKGLISLIPPDVRILSVTVRGNTAYISFSEEFQYNSYGVEGYAGQLRQIVFTVTEFPNVTDVQILVEGRRLDYLGEGIWIGSPLNRDRL